MLSQGNGTGYSEVTSLDGQVARGTAPVGVALTGPGAVLLDGERGCGATFGGRVGPVRGPGCRSEPQCLPAAGFRECRHPTHHRGLLRWEGGGRSGELPGASADDAECRWLLGRLRDLLRGTVGSVLQGAGRQVRVTLRHARVRMAQDLLHLIQAATTVHEHRGMLVAQVVDAEFW